MRPLALVIAATVLALPLVDASPCPRDGSPEVTTPATGVSLSDPDGSSNPGIYYVDNDPCQPDCIVSIWVYEETNGEPGLQRDDDVCDGGCGCEWRERDTIIL